MIDNAYKLLSEGSPITAERVSGVNDNMYSSHYHDFYELYYLESGERHHLIDENIHLVTPGQFIFFEPYVLHRSYGEQDVPFSRLLIYFKKDQIASKKMIHALKGFTGVYQLSSGDQRILYRLLHQILEEQEHPEDFHEEHMKSLLNTLLVLILRNRQQKKLADRNNKMTEIISYINLNYAQKITIDLLSKTFYISPWHLCREFKTCTSITIVQYVNYIRIIQAQKMLYSSKKKITEICSEVGFENITHFERIFKSIVGQTPSQFRKNEHIIE